MAVTQSRPNILYHCAKFGGDRTSLSVIFLRVRRLTREGLYPYFDISVFYLSVISRDIDLTFIQDTYRVVINSTNNWKFM